MGSRRVLETWRTTKGEDEAGKKNDLQEEKHKITPIFGSLETGGNRNETENCNRLLKATRKRIGGKGPPNTEKIIVPKSERQNGEAKKHTQGTIMQRGALQSGKI